MERNKSSGCARGQKKISGPVGSEFFALGAKTSRDDSKSKIISAKGSCILPDRKRESSSSVSNYSKKPKMSRSFGDSFDVTIHESWDQLAIDCESTELMEFINTGLENNDNEYTFRVLCGSIKHLMEPYTLGKFDSVLYLGLIYIAKIRPDLFCDDVITSGLVHILRREVNIKMRQSSNSHVIASNLLTKGYHEKYLWPEQFLRLYIEDAINERFWSDNELCLPFIKNISSGFRTTIPSNVLLQTDNFLGSTVQQHRDLLLAVEDDSGDGSINTDSNALTRLLDVRMDADTAFLVHNRYKDNENLVERLVLDAVKEQLNKRQQPDWHTRNVLKFLCSTSGLSDIRSLCISRLELWIHNGKLVKLAQKLLSYICFNIKMSNIKDHEVLASLVKIRLKTKPLLNFFMSCLKEMLTDQPDVLCVLLKLVVQNELSNTRNPNNMGMLATMFQTSPEQASKYLAEIYKDFLLQREDYLRTLRVFLRELVRILRFDMNIVQFCKTFLNGRGDLMDQIERSEFKDRIFSSMVDLICLCMILSVSPQIREAFNVLRSNRELKSNPALLNFYANMSQIQLDAISWMYETVPTRFKVQAVDYGQALHKILLLDSPEQYSRSDQWPSEPERGTLLRIISETPVLEETLLRIILIGITKDIPLTIPDTIDILMMVIKRASTMRIQNCPAVQANKYDIIDFMFSMVEYHYPDNIKLPPDYIPPKFAITVLYWKSWLIMLMISAHNPSTFGAFCWKHYPMMKMLIEMCITNQFNDQYVPKEELQLFSLEREQILQLESYLAAQTSQAVITEENAILISQLMLMDPMGPARRIPTAVLEQIKSLNKTLKLGYLLCRCRNPDLLLDIIQRQGTSKSMPWLSDLVQNSEGDFSYLPVQCLCEFLLFNANTINEENSRDAELVTYLRNLIMEEDSSKKTVCEVLEYIFRRLSSTLKQSRDAAIGGLKIIFKDNKSDNDWLIRSIPQIKYFKDICSFMIPQLRSACQVENSPELVMSYIQFIAAHTINDSVVDMLDHVVDMAQLIVERSTMFQHIIPASGDLLLDVENKDSLYECRFQTLKCLFVMFNNYIIKLREHHEPYEWTEYPDLLMVQFEDGTQLPLHLNIIHAFIILLTQSSSKMPESIPILDYWFPLGRRAPTAFLPNMPHETIQLLPDWLKLKMIRSSVDRLIEAALFDLTPDQIVLFVQNFGTPINSMSKLLALLDHAVNEELDSVKDAILNKAYLAQLIEIQQARGAKNGHFTVKALGLYSHSQTIPDFPKHSNLNLRFLNTNQIQYSAVLPAGSCRNNKDIEDVVNNLTKSSHSNPINNNLFRTSVHHLLGRFNNSTKHCTDLQAISSEMALTSLLRAMERSKGAMFNENFSKKRHICTMLRILLINNSITLEEYNRIQKELKSDSSFYYKSISDILMRKMKCDNTGANLTRANAHKIIVSNVWDQFSPSAMPTRISELDSSERKEQIRKANNLCRDGLQVDYVFEVDPEFSYFNKQKQVLNLFKKNCHVFRFHLLSLICHQTSWETLILILKYLMQEKQSDIDSSTALNFIEVLINNPKLWQGRDKSISKVHVPEVMFIFSEQELENLISFIIDEGEAGTGIDFSSDKQDYNVCSRINLLFQFTSNRYNYQTWFSKKVMNQSCSQSLKLRAIQQMYLLHPSIKFMPTNMRDNPFKFTSLRGWKADKVSNNLITCLGNLFLRKDFEALSSYVELLIRKFAASHPMIFLRQLGVLSSLIHGKAQLNVRILREEYHLHRFIQILRTFQLLQPMVFDDCYKTEFQSALECYFTLFKHHSYIKESYHILIRFVELLQAYININPSSALLYIEKHVSILLELSVKFNAITPLQQLVQGITLLNQKGITANELSEDDNKEVDQDEQSSSSSMLAATDVEMAEAGAFHQIEANCKGPVTLAIYTSCNKSIILSQRLTDLIKVVKTSNTEESILGPLQEIESFTSKHFSLLNEIFDRLLELIFSPSAQIRSNAYILLIRHLKHNPGRTDINRCALNAYIQCLRDDNSSVATTAVDNLVEITLLLQEYAVEILSVAFNLGIKSHLNTSIQIKRVLQTLMLQYGY